MKAKALSFDIFALTEPKSDADFMALFDEFMAESACFSAHMAKILAHSEQPAAVS